MCRYGLRPVNNMILYAKKHHTISYPGPRGVGLWELNSHYQGQKRANFYFSTKKGTPHKVALRVILFRGLKQSTRVF